MWQKKTTNWLACHVAKEIVLENVTLASLYSHLHTGPNCYLPLRLATSQHRTCTICSLISPQSFSKVELLHAQLQYLALFSQAHIHYIYVGWQFLVSADNSRKSYACRESRKVRKRSQELWTLQATQTPPLALSLSCGLGETIGTGIVRGIYGEEL